MKLNRARLRPPGDASPGPLTYAAPAALVALALAGGWCAYAWLTPVASISYDASSAMPAPVRIDDARASVDERDARLERLALVNHYDDDLAFWQRRAPAVAQQDQTTSAEPARTNEPPPLPVDLEQLAANDVQLTAEEDVPDDVKSARKNLELKGLYLDPISGNPTARLGFVNRQRGTTTPRQPGDHFTDPSHDASPWVVGRVQLDRQRVVLVRSGATIAIDLFPEGAGAQPAQQPRQAYRPDEGVPRVQGRTRDDIVRDLRDAGVSESDILAAVRLMELPTDDLDLAPPTVVDLTPATPEISEQEIRNATTGAPQMPAGLLELLRQGQELMHAREERARADCYPAPPPHPSHCGMPRRRRQRGDRPPEDLSEIRARPSLRIDAIQARRTRTVGVRRVQHPVRGPRQRIKVAHGQPGDLIRLPAREVDRVERARHAARGVTHAVQHAVAPHRDRLPARGPVEACELDLRTLLRHDHERVGRRVQEHDRAELRHRHAAYPLVPDRPHVAHALDHARIRAHLEQHPRAVVVPHQPVSLPVLVQVRQHPARPRLGTIDHSRGPHVHAPVRVHDERHRLAPVRHPHGPSRLRPNVRTFPTPRAPEGHPDT